MRHKRPTISASARRLLKIVVAQHHRHAVRLGRSDCRLHALIAGKRFDVD